MTVNEVNLMMLVRDNDDDDDDDKSLQDINGQSSFGSMFNASFSTFRTMVDQAMVNLKDNVDSEITVPQTQHEVIRGNAVKTEKDARIRDIMIGDEEFRQFKKTMHADGVVTTNAINQSISRSIGKRVSMDMANQQTRRAASMNLVAQQSIRSARFEQSTVGSLNKSVGLSHNCN